MKVPQNEKQKAKMANEQNLRVPTTDEAREIGRKGGLASGKARKERKTIADALRMVLNEQAAPGSDATRLDAIVSKVVKNLYDNGDIRDLKILSDLLGESIQNINLKTDEPFRVEVNNETEKAKLEKLLERE